MLVSNKTGPLASSLVSKYAEQTLAKHGGRIVKEAWGKPQGLVARAIHFSSRV